jgi:hypothetical protein
MNTPVEFIEDYLKFKGFIIDEPNTPQVLVGIINESKEAERLLIVNAYNLGCIDTLKNEMKTGEQYYNEKFKKDE